MPRARVALGACVCALVVYSALGLNAHQALRTNAFDLSVFDYALWTTASGGGLGYVPMFRHSLFAQHFMPTLLLLAPLSRLFDSPAYLIVLQTAFFAVAGFLLFRLAERRAPSPLALALLAAFLLSRRSAGAVTSYFYLESAEPMLIFGAVLAWSTARKFLYWTLVVLALGCKEDVAVYFLVFGGALVVTRRDRMTGLATLALAGSWLLVSVFVAIPYWRQLYELGTTNPFLEGRYGLGETGLGGRAVVQRLFSLRSLGKLVTVTSSTAFLCFLSPSWLVVALPGIAINLGARPDTAQAGLTGHYLWPILPWLFLAAVFGAKRVPASAIRWLPFAVLVVTLVDTPLPRSIVRAPWKGLPAAELVRSQLRALAPSGTLVAQPNLIPQLPTRRLEVHGLGVYSAGQPSGDYVLLTTVGDLWPFDSQGVAREVARLQADSRYEQVASGPLFAFRKRQLVQVHGAAAQQRAGAGGAELALTLRGSARFVGQQYRLSNRVRTQYVIGAVMLLGSVNVGGQESTRTRYQGIIADKYPGFRLLQAGDFEVVSPAIQDGVRGALLVGRFDFDDDLDFAALIIPSTTSRYSSGNYSYDYYKGKIITCFGSSGGTHFRCDAVDRLVTLPYDTVLERIAPGRYTCRAEQAGHVLITEIDSVGEASEKAASFLTRSRDGTTRTCVTAD